jgi:hypothetical protein
MIRKDNKVVESAFLGQKPINKIYHGIKLVWEFIAGCFTKGFWINSRQWTNDKGWKNN